MTDFNLNKHPRKQPYTVPQGYFDTLTENVMRRLPSEQTHIKPFILENSSKMLQTKNVQKNKLTFNQLRWISSAAAIILFAFFSFQIGKLHLTHQQIANTVKADGLKQKQNTPIDEDYQNDVLEYAMVDQSDIYNYLSGTDI